MPAGRSYSDPDLRRFLTGRELMLYDEGYEQGFIDASPSREYVTGSARQRGRTRRRAAARQRPRVRANRPPNRWNKYVAKKANAIRYKSGAKKGKLNLGAMATKYRKKYKLKKGA